MRLSSDGADQVFESMTWNQRQQIIVLLNGIAQTEVCCADEEQGYVDKAELYLEGSCWIRTRDEWEWYWTLDGKLVQQGSKQVGHPQFTEPEIAMERLHGKVQIILPKGVTDGH